MSSQLKSTQSEVSALIGFIQKYGIQYYTTTALYLVYAIFNHYFDRPFYFFAFMVLFPFLGKLMPKDDLQVKNAQYHNKNIYHSLPLVSCIIANFILIAYLCIDFPYFNINLLEGFMAIYSLMLLITPSIDASHELIHRPQMFFKVLGFLNMTIFLFNVYPTKHLYLHHKYVGTSKDPITSKKNTTYYFYFIRAYFSAYKFVFQYSKLIFFACISAIIIYVGAIYAHGLHQYGNPELAWQRLQFILILGFGGFLLLEGIEYVEHYGLIFREDANKNEINELCSWNTDTNMLHNWMIFRFQRHSDHHMNAYKYFTTLELTEKMPKFPVTFIQALYLALIPPLWCYIMNPYVDQVLENKPVRKSHAQLAHFSGHSVLIVLIAVCVYCYHQTISNLEFSL